MKYFLTTLVFLSILRPDFKTLNTTKDTMELGKLIFDKDLLKKFVTDEFEPAVYINKMEKTMSGHPLMSYNYNRTVKNKAIKFTLFGLPVDSVFVYKNDKSQFCTYIIMEIKSPDFDKFAEELGYPENTLKEEYDVRDFQFLYWNINGFGMFVNKLHRYQEIKHRSIIQVMNMKLEELLDRTHILD